MLRRVRSRLPCRIRFCGRRVRTLDCSLEGGNIAPFNMAFKIEQIDCIPKRHVSHLLYTFLILYSFISPRCFPLSSRLLPSSNHHQNHYPPSSPPHHYQSHFPTNSPSAPAPPSPPTQTSSVSSAN